MALEDLNPAVRVEEILDGADIEPATRLEYFMKKAANEVPKYTSADKGKVLTVGEGSETVQTVIVPEQTVTLTVPEEGLNPDAAILTGADFSSVSVGTVALMSVNGVARTVTAVDPFGDGGIVFPYGDENNTAIRRSAFTGDIKFTSDVAGTYTVSLSCSVPSVEPKWKTAGGGIFKISSDQSTGALDKNYTEIKAAMSEGLLPVMFAGGSVSIPIVSAASENNAFNVYGISVRQGALFLIKWSAILPNGPLTPVT
jgi:hypothetical protein